MIRMFCGYDAREAIGFHVFIASVLEHSRAPLSITPLGHKGLPQGSNAFTYSRFLVPWLCGFEGHAIYVDACDMLMLGDIAELDALFDPQYAVQVVQHQNYKTQHPIKYVGTEMECPNVNYARKNWTSVMLINCAHTYWSPLDPQTLDKVAALSLLQLGGLKPSEVGALPNEWNRLADEGQPTEGAKVLHFTAGSPAFPRYANTPGADQWRAARDRMLEVA